MGTTRKIKITLLLALIVFVNIADAQDSLKLLHAPPGWEHEIFSFPIEFAPHIPYQGFEEVHFTPGWGDTASEDLWSYCFVWSINGDSKVNQRTLKENLEEYYNGLVSRNIIRRQIDSSKVVPTIAHVNVVKAEVFVATVDMLDYMSQRPVKLNINISIKQCKNSKAVFFAVSPQPASHRIWSEFASMWKDFKCVD
jgi:hypothetical protein